jgi:hypothetical protein
MRGPELTLPVDASQAPACRLPERARAAVAACALLPMLACAHVPEPASYEPAAAGEARSFWELLQPLCGHAFEGTPVHVPDADTAFATQRLVMHVADCDAAEMRIPLHVGPDRSRTWVLRRVGAGLELKHIHRHEDGTAASNTNYGGMSAARGTPHRQEFPADAFSVAAVPARATQFWFIEHYPGSRFVYGLFRRETGMHYRIEFDLARSVPPPPPPW